MITSEKVFFHHSEPLEKVTFLKVIIFMVSRFRIAEGIFPTCGKTKPKNEKMAWGPFFFCYIRSRDSGKIRSGRVGSARLGSGRGDVGFSEYKKNRKRMKRCRIII